MENLNFRLKKPNKKRTAIVNITNQIPSAINTHDLGGQHIEQDCDILRKTIVTIENEFIVPRETKKEQIMDVRRNIIDDGLPLSIIHT